MFLLPTRRDLTNLRALSVLAATAGLIQVADTTVLVVAGRRLGPVTAHSTVQSLRSALGIRNVQVDYLDVGEGTTEPGAVLFPTEPRRRAYVYWRDTIQFRSPSRIAVRDSGTAWTLPVAVPIGTSLLELERLNGRPFRFSGFGSDYAGRVRDWNGGKLTGALGPGFDLRITLRETCQPTLSESSLQQVFGEQDVWSSNPVALALCPVVEELWLGIPP